MFKFNYLIYDSMKKKLKNISIKEFEEEYSMIYGAFELLINGKMYNYIVRYEDQKFCNEKEKEEFDDLFELQDIISLWIIIFLEICIELKKKDYVAVMDIESENWLEFKKIYNELYISQIEEEKVNETNSESISGKTFVITGELNHFNNRGELVEKIESLGGKVSGSVSKKTNYLINNDKLSSSSKNKKANELGIEIISEDDFLKMI